MTDTTPQQVITRLVAARRGGLFLDYDGTLDDFAPTPDHINRNPEIVSILTRLTRFSRLQIAVISGRPLKYVQALVPVPGILLAGTYGLELLLPDGKQIDRAQLATIRPVLDQLKPQWARLIADRSGFYLEDKTWSLALHARFAEPMEAGDILQQAQRLASQVASAEQFRLLGGHKFLEVAPALANKGLTVEYLLEHLVEPQALPVYLGDDDKDEEAFGVITAHGGTAIVVASQPRETRAQCRLESPAKVRGWLGELERALLSFTHNMSGR